MKTSTMESPSASQKPDVYTPIERDVASQKQVK
jgi:hypothetical protein